MCFRNGVSEYVHKSIKMNWLQNILPPNWTYALGWTVVHSLWQGILIASVMAFLMDMRYPQNCSNVRGRILNESKKMRVACPKKVVKMLKNTNKKPKNVKKRYSNGCLENKNPFKRR